MSRATRKPVFGVCDQVWHISACSASEACWGLEISAIARKGIILSRQRTTKALIRLRGWSKQVFSWRGSNNGVKLVRDKLYITGKQYIQGLPNNSDRRCHDKEIRTPQTLKMLWDKMSRLVTNPTKWLCTQRRLGSAWGSAQSDQSSLCAQCGQRRLWLGWADAQDYLSLRWAHNHIVGFVVRRLKCKQSRLWEKHWWHTKWPYQHYKWTVSNTAINSTATEPLT